MFIQESSSAVFAIDLKRYQRANRREAEPSSGLELDSEELVGSTMHECVQHGLVHLRSLNQAPIPRASLHRLRESHEEPEAILLCPIVRSHRQAITVNCDSQCDVSNPDQVALRANGDVHPLASATDVFLANHAGNVIHNSANTGSKGLELATPTSAAHTKPSPTPPACVVA
jgi:hypothetical protein